MPFLHEREAKLDCLTIYTPDEVCGQPRTRAYTPKTCKNNCSSTASFSTVSSLLTLFSKFFSSFLRSTCSLSVSRVYLALEEVYLPLRAAVPNNPTLRSLSYSIHSPTTGLSPSLTSCSKELMRVDYFRIDPIDYNSSRRTLQIYTLSFSLFTRSY